MPLLFIKENWNWVVAMVGGVFGLGVAKSRIVTKKEIYNVDGSLIYVRRDAFGEIIKEIKDTMEDQGKTLTDFNRTLGRIEQFMDDSKRK